MIDNALLLFTKNDIPFPSAKLIIHNPTINELSLIGEESFRISLYLITTVIKDIKSQGNFGLSDKTEFDILIEIINKSDDEISLSYKNHFLKLLSIIFPNYSIRIRKKDIQITEITENAKTFFIDVSNFEEFQNILSEIFFLNGQESFNNSYNPADKRAEKIANKLKNKKNKKADEDMNKISVYKKYASILSVGMHMDVNIFLNYTVAQLEDQFKRYMSWMQWDNVFKMRLAGATGLDEVEDWMKDV